MMIAPIEGSAGGCGTGSDTGKRRHQSTAATSSAALLLDRMENVHSAGRDRWMACCPAHPDKSPSLAIRDTSDTVLLHCFAGCRADGVLAAVGLTWGDLFPDRSPGQPRPRHDLQRERTILRVAAMDLRNGRALSPDDRTRVELARQRLGRAYAGAR